jgi:hypothetical protein
MSEPIGNPHLDTSLLPIFQKYKGENESWIPNFSIWSYLNLRADFDLAAAFSKLFWPDLVEADGCVFLSERYQPENFADWKERFNGDQQRIEAMINHVHVWDMFLNSPKDVDYPKQLHQYLAEVLAVCWKHALQEAFPDKKFVVSVFDDPVYSYGPEITFYQAKGNAEEQISSWSK